MAFQNLEHGDCVRHHRCDKCQTLDGGTTHWALPVHNSFGDLDHISRSQQYQTVLTENFVVLNRLSENFVWLLSKAVDNEDTTIFHFYLLNKGNNWCVLWLDKNFNVGFLADTV